MLNQSRLWKKSVTLGIAAALAVVIGSGSARAYDDGYYGHPYWHHHHHEHLIVGPGGVVYAAPEPVYVAPPPPVYVAPAPVYYPPSVDVVIPLHVR